MADKQRRRLQVAAVKSGRSELSGVELNYLKEEIRGRGREKEKDKTEIEEKKSRKDETIK